VAFHQFDKWIVDKGRRLADAHVSALTRGYCPNLDSNGTAASLSHIKLGHYRPGLSLDKENRPSVW
jgi:hypothetical protein